MKTKLTKIITILTLGLIGLSSPLVAPSVLAAGTNDPCDSSLPQAVLDANGCSNTTEPTLQTTITEILKAIILIAGLVAVIFIVIGGINYMTSAGDASKVKKAKDTILFACIGLIICALAFAIVNWVIGGVLDQ